MRASIKTTLWAGVLCVTATGASGYSEIAPKCNAVLSNYKAMSKHLPDLTVGEAQECEKEQDDGSDYFMSLDIWKFNGYLSCGADGLFHHLELNLSSYAMPDDDDAREAPWIDSTRSSARCL
ncbi:hypothetical protein [Methylocella sp.]|jgi:hypothetical protein|uniref:hypothetical protein n=1 Tax=Methylocella sp. TaxID=1978226 RepID=UPI003C2A683E